MNEHPLPSASAETALLVGVQTPMISKEELDESLNELALLAGTAGASVAGRVTQSLDKLRAATYVGKGKVQEIKVIVGEKDIDLVLFDDDLSPSQARNLEQKLDVKVLDRSGVILDIFASRAKTSTAKAQVELAQLEYMRSRLTRAWTHLARQAGGIGTRGPGETQIETDRRLIDRRIATLRAELERIEKQRKTQRKGRRQITRIALVGYTNAGKSTLMNALAESEQLAEDRLFATLDATTRHVSLDTNKTALLSDTVGFIRKLPPQLVESFKSTLDEVREADILLHVVDVSHPHFEDHIEVVNRTLQELGARDIPTIMVFNKVDELDDRGVLSRLESQYDPAVTLSALRGIGLERLREQSLEQVEADYVSRIAVVPMTQPKSLSHIYRLSDVVDEETGMATWRENGEKPVPAMRMHVRVSKKNLGILEQKIDEFGEIQWVG